MSSVAIAISDPIERKSLAILVESLGYSCSTFADASSFLNSFEATSCSCLLIAANGDFSSEVERFRKSNDVAAGTRIIWLTDGCDTSAIVKAMRAGASAVLEFPFTYEEVSEAIRFAVREYSQFMESEGRKLPEEFSNLFTREEEEIALLLIDRAATKEIAAKLDVSVRTVHYRKNSICEKLGARNCREAIDLLSKPASVVPRAHLDSGTRSKTTVRVY